MRRGRARGLAAWVGAVALGLVPAAADETGPAGRRSDTVLLAPETRAMQADDTANPGMLSVLDGEDLWNAPAGTTARACASCHGEGSMRGVAARYPAAGDGGAPITLSGRINLCRVTHQGAPPLPFEGRELLGLEAYVAHQSRGLPIAPPAGEAMDAARERGRALFTRRVGGLNLSCAICHDDNAGKRLGGTVIPQAHPVGYPIYRLEWQALGSLQRRLRNCMTGVRAEPHPFGAPELADLEAYLMERAAGLGIETPAVRP